MRFCRFAFESLGFQCPSGKYASRPFAPKEYGARTDTELACCLPHFAAVFFELPDNIGRVAAHTQILAKSVQYVLVE